VFRGVIHVTVYVDHRLRPDEDNVEFWHIELDIVQLYRQLPSPLISFLFISIVLSLQSETAISAWCCFESQHNIDRTTSHIS